MTTETLQQASVTWWNTVKSTGEFTQWLLKQYVGEVTAADRIRELGTKFKVDAKTMKILEVIAGQEEQHAVWIAELLETRGVTAPAVDSKQAEQRYWKETLPGITDFDTGAAVAAHAEAMRLERIKAIVKDRTAPWDVRETFIKILRDELFHERAFRKMASASAMDATREKHQLGLEALGLAA